MNMNFTDALDRYCALTGAVKSQKMVDACDFINHIVDKVDEAAIQIDCGTGKSSWAHARCAAYASKATPHVYVVPTRDEVTRAASNLTQMTNGEAAGIYLGWNQDECQSLSGRNLTFDKCMRTGSKSACARCPGRKLCLYRQSLRGLRRPLVVMTRESFIVLCGKGFDFTSHTILCDEDINVFADEIFTLGGMRRLADIFSMAGDYNVSQLVRTLMSGAKFWAAAPVPDSAARYMRLDSDSVAHALAEILRYMGTHTLKRDDELLVFRFVMFFRSAAACKAAYAYYFDGRDVFVKKNRIDLQSFTAYKKLIILNATASLSMVRLSGRAKIWRCRELEKYRREGSVSLFIVPANATKSRADRNTAAGLQLLSEHILAAGCEPDTWVLVVANRNDGGRADRVEAALGAEYGLSVFRLSRGLLRGTNAAKQCTIAFLPSAGFFTTLVDCALHVALKQGKDFLWSEVVCHDGRPRMRKGRFINSKLQDVYMRKSLTEFYQGIFRTAVRDGGSVAVILPLPDAEWVTALWRLTPFKVRAVHGGGRKARLFSGIGTLLDMEAGKPVSKTAVAELLGYKAWKSSRTVIMKLLKDFYVVSGRNLVRRDV
ncbi:MAG TPA: hypothetical protein DET40_04635 [Lentisphaeria bacterium]|nr:MAG: hypothetical protein A2X45_21485 [Lentisphaerae bacterium GWF2_50_93]HCE42811.1 hypothetical protein [Lentisphaeria bacterium]